MPDSEDRRDAIPTVGEPVPDSHSPTVSEAAVNVSLRTGRPTVEFGTNCRRVCPRLAFPGAAAELPECQPEDRQTYRSRILGLAGAIPREPTERREVKKGWRCRDFPTIHLVRSRWIATLCPSEGGWRCLQRFPSGDACRGCWFARYLASVAVSRQRIGQNRWPA